MSALRVLCGLLCISVFLLSTIIGNIRQVSTAPFKTLIKFLPLSTPLADDESLVTTSQLLARPNDDGDFSVVLELGDYEVWVGKDRLLINVPDDDNTYNIIQRITGSLVFTPTTPVGGAQPYASATVAGIVRVNGTQVPPVAALANTAVLRTGMRSSLARLPGVGAVTIDFDGAAIVVISVAGNMQISTTHRIGDTDTEAKHVSLILRNTGGPATIDFGDIEIFKPKPPTTLGVGKEWVVGLISLGSLEADTRGAWSEL